MSGPKARPQSPSSIRTIQQTPPAQHFRPDELNHLQQSGFHQSYPIYQYQGPVAAAAASVQDMNKQAQMQHSMSPSQFAMPQPQFPSMHATQPRPATQHIGQIPQGFYPRQRMATIPLANQAQSQPQLVYGPGLVGYHGQPQSYAMLTSTPNPNFQFAQPGHVPAASFIISGHQNTNFVPPQQQQPQQAYFTNNGMYYPQQPSPMAVPAHQGAQVPMATQPTIARPQQPLPPKQSRRLLIIDPATNAEVLVGNYRATDTPPQSGDSSARLTPASSAPPTTTVNSEVAVQFMNKVAASLGPPKHKARASHEPSHTPEPAVSAVDVMDSGQFVNQVAPSLGQPEHAARAPHESSHMPESAAVGPADILDDGQSRELSPALGQYENPDTDDINVDYSGAGHHTVPQGGYGEADVGDAYMPDRYIADEYGNVADGTYVDAVGNVGYIEDAQTTTFTQIQDPIVQHHNISAAADAVVPVDQSDGHTVSYDIDNYDDEYVTDYSGDFVVEYSPKPARASDTLEAPAAPQIESYVDLQNAADMRQDSVKCATDQPAPPAAAIEKQSKSIIAPLPERKPDKRSDSKDNKVAKAEKSGLGQSSKNDKVTKGDIQTKTSRDKKGDKSGGAKANKSASVKNNVPEKAAEDITPAVAAAPVEPPVEPKDAVTEDEAADNVDPFYSAGCVNVHFTVESVADKTDDAECEVKNIPVVIGNRPDATSIYDQPGYYLASPPMEAADVSGVFDETASPVCQPSSDPGEAAETVETAKEDEKAESGKSNSRNRSKAKEITIQTSSCEAVVSDVSTPEPQPLRQTETERLPEPETVATSVDDSTAPEEPSTLAVKDEAAVLDGELVTGEETVVGEDGVVEAENFKNDDKSMESSVVVETQDGAPAEATKKRPSEPVLRYEYKEVQNVSVTNDLVTAAFQPRRKFSIESDPHDMFAKIPKTDQWSPLNPEGKKLYDRNFLLAIQFSQESLTKPLDLPQLEIILDKPHIQPDTKSQNQSPPRFSAPDFMPSYARQHSRSGANDRMNLSKRGSREQQNRMKDQQPRRVITSTMIPAEVKLNTAENAWKPAHKEAKLEDPEQAETAAIYKKVRSILNKLTPQKFDTLVDQVSALNVNNDLRLRGVVDLMFEKAIDEPAFSVAYANMCKKLSVDGFQKKIDTKLFKNILLTSCQREFEQDRAAETDVEQREEEIKRAPSDAKKQQLQEELSLDIAKVKRRTLGNIRFIGELYKLKMLNDRVMHGCINGLLTQDEEKLECLCRLMSTIGKELDQSDQSKNYMNSYFEQMNKIIEKRTVSSRIRFMLQDTIELKKNKWVPRRKENNPKTIDEVHKEIKQEEAKKLVQREALKNMPKPTPNRGRGSMGPSGSDEWQNVTKPTRNFVDPSKFKNISAGARINTDVELGPGPKFSNWGRGAVSSKSQEPEKSSDRSRTTNRFSAISNLDDASKSRSIGPGSAGRNEPRPFQPYGRESAGRDLGSGRGSGGAKSGPRTSFEKDREKALSSAKSLRNQNQPPSRGASRENSETRVRAPVPTSEMPIETVVHKSNNIIQEYLSSQIMAEAIDLVKELNTSRLDKFVSVGMNQVVERSDVTRQHMAKLLHELVVMRVISEKAYITGFNEVMDEAAETAVDVPKIWEYLGELIGPMILDRVVPLAQLRESILKAEHKAGRLMSEILHFCARRVGHEEVAKIWRESGLQWHDFLPPNASLEQFLESSNLKFTVVNRQCNTTSDLRRISEGLDVLLRSNANNEAVFTWIEENVDPALQDDISFIRVLMTSVCNNAIVSNYRLDKAQFKKLQRDALLMKFLDHKPDRELHAIYALQALVNKLSFPPGLLQSLFDVLYDEDLISEDAFKQWLDSKDPAEQEGKGVAGKQLQQFFSSLNETTDS